jgi:uncharacterized protein YndB with AHSA1/START domain
MAKAQFEVDKANLEVRLSRVFNASPERIWQAYVDPEQIPKWWQDTKVDKLDVRVGGQWRFVSGENGEHAFSGVHKIVDEPYQLARTFEYEPMAGHVMLETVTLTPQGEGQTLVTVVSKYENLDDLNGMVGMGMEEGAVAGMERLAKVVEQS